LAHAVHGGRAHAAVGHEEHRRGRRLPARPADLRDLRRLLAERARGRAGGGGAAEQQAQVRRLDDAGGAARGGELDAGRGRACRRRSRPEAGGRRRPPCDRQHAAGTVADRARPGGRAPADDRPRGGGRRQAHLPRRRRAQDVAPRRRPDHGHGRDPRDVRAGMSKLIYSALASLDGDGEDADGAFPWAGPARGVPPVGTGPREEVHAFANELEGAIAPHLYGRRMYETMAYWESPANTVDGPAVVQEYGEIWRAAHKVGYSRTLEAVATRRTR